MRSRDAGLNLEFWNDIAVLDQNRTLLRGHLETQGVDPHAVHRVEVAFDELVTNIIKYGFADALAHRISVTIRVAADSVALLFDDDGREFDPTAAASPPLPGSIDQAKPGGLGLMLLRRMSSEMHYERVGSRNKTLIRIGIRTSRRSDDL